MKLTKPLVAGLRAPKGKEIWTWDDAVPGCKLLSKLLMSRIGKRGHFYSRIAMPIGINNHMNSKQPKAARWTALKMALYQFAPTNLWE